MVFVMIKKQVFISYHQCYCHNITCKVLIRFAVFHLTQTVRIFTAGPRSIDFDRLWLFESCVRSVVSSLPWAVISVDTQRSSGCVTIPVEVALEMRSTKTLGSCSIGINRFWFFVFYYEKQFWVGLVDQLFQLASNRVQIFGNAFA